MLLLLSPAKSLDFERPLPANLPHTRPQFIKQAALLIDLLRGRSVQDIASLMKLSDALATLNVERYRQWRPRHDERNSRQAILAFNGDVYDGLDARTLDLAQLEWAQEHVVMLSGLYGVLRPLDRMQPYRLEMGTRLANERGPNLYAFWGATIAGYLNRRQAGESPRLVLNLASEEYFAAVDRKVLKARVVQCVFEDWHNGQFRIISFSAKRARGMMARHVIETRAQTPEALLGFNAGGYRFDGEVSTDDRLVFRRVPAATGPDSAPRDARVAA